MYFDYSFGLTGKVKMSEDGIISKVNAGAIYGGVDMSREKAELLEGLGISWMHADESLISRHGC